MVYNLARPYSVRGDLLMLYLPNLPLKHFNDATRTPQHFIVSESQKPNSVTLYFLLTNRISPSRIFRVVALPVYLNREVQFRTIKINYVLVYSVLSSKLVSEELLSFEATPERYLRPSHVSAKVLSGLFLFLQIEQIAHNDHLTPRLHNHPLIPSFSEGVEARSRV